MYALPLEKDASQKPHLQWAARARARLRYGCSQRARTIFLQKRYCRPATPEAERCNHKNVRFAFRKTHPKSNICKGLLGRARLRYGCSQRACAFFSKTGVAVQLHPQVQSTKNVAFANKNAY